MQSFDLLLLLRAGASLDPRVDYAISAQQGVHLRRHIVVGTRNDRAEHRWETISRARNHAKRLSQSPWVMFLDDDVLLAPSCAHRLGEALAQRPRSAALAADYLSEGGGSRAPHVAMGATLFRREALEAIDFRWEPGRCECQCCCDDLRGLGWSIGYWPRAYATHLKRQNPHNSPPSAAAGQPEGPIEMPTAGQAAARDGRILVAFDARHFDRFVHQFLRSLRQHGNGEVVTVVVYGLSPLQVAWLGRLKRVEVVPMPDDGRAVPVRRLEDFQHAMEGWAPDTSVAYWDAGDVVVQTRLDRLWRLVYAHPDKILAVREPQCHPENRAVATWTMSILDPSSRQKAYDLLTRRPVLNSGFAAGTARSLLRYFQEAERLRKSPALFGSSDWGDQTALNLYCHSHADRWQEIDEAWNYCLYGRRRGEVCIDRQSVLVRSDGKPIFAVHGSAGTLRSYRIHNTLP